MDKIKSWFDFFKNYESENITSVIIHNQEEDYAEIVLNSIDKELEITITTFNNFMNLHDLNINFKFKNKELSYNAHFEGLPFSVEDTKYLHEYLKPLLIEGWWIKEYLFLMRYKCSMLNNQKQKPIGPTIFYNWYGILFWIVSIFDLLSFKTWTHISPKIKAGICA